MKLPIAVEASVADELRTWLASELEQLDASSTNQFAHHVVTILLHEDLDIEDEPLSSGDDFLADIFSRRQTKTREKRKKAAVQFLRSAVCCDETADAFIQLVVDELMQKIDATKSKMQSRKASKRSLLSPLIVNVVSPVKKNGAKKWVAADEQRYNEAFPSLSGDESPNKGAQASVSTSGSSWNKSPGIGKENQKKRVRRRIGSRCTLLFRSAEEAWACDIARETAAVVLEDLNFSAKEAMEVWAPSHMGSQPLTDPPMMFCWKSAFSRTSLMTRPFYPSTAPLQFLKPVKRGYASREILPVVLGDRACKRHPECPHMDALSHWEDMGFVPVSSMERRQARDRRKRRNLKVPKGLKDVDSEVRFYLCSAEGDNDESEGGTEDSHVGPEDNDMNEVGSLGGEVEGAVSFPSHYGSYWQDLISQGFMSLYPSFENAHQQKEEEEEKLTMATIWSPRSPMMDRPNCFNKDFLSMYKTGDAGVEFFGTEKMEIGEESIANEIAQVENHPHLFEIDDTNDEHSLFDFGLSMIFDSEEDGLTELGRDNTEHTAETGRMPFSPEDLSMVRASQVDAVLSTHLSHQRHIPMATEQDTASSLGDSAVEWDSPWCCTEWDDINQDILASIMGTKATTPNPYLPPRLASCLSSEHSQFLQSAFVNAFFSSKHMDVFMQAWKPPKDTDQKTNIVQFFDEHQFFRTKIWPVELVKGSTCSNWLENNCKLGLLCPFSHPSI